MSEVPLYLVLARLRWGYSPVQDVTPDILHGTASPKLWPSYTGQDPQNSVHSTRECIPKSPAILHGTAFPNLQPSYAGLHSQNSGHPTRDTVSKTPAILHGTRSPKPRQSYMTLHAQNSGRVSWVASCPGRDPHISYAFKLFRSPPRPQRLGRSNGSSVFPVWALRAIGPQTPRLIHYSQPGPAPTPIPLPAAPPAAPPSSSP